MDTAYASLTGTLRIIALLVLVWVVLGFLRNRFGGRRKGAPPRKPGDVRIEYTRENDRRGKGPDGPVSDADFEEVK